MKKTRVFLGVVWVLLFLISDSVGAVSYQQKWIYQADSRANCLAVSASGGYVVIGTPSAVHLVDSNKNLQWRYATDHPIVDVAMTDDASWIAAGGSSGYFGGGRVYFFHNRSAPPEYSIAASTGLSSVAFSPEGDYFAMTYPHSLGWDDVVSFWGDVENRWLWSYSFGLNDTAAVAVSQAGNFLAVGAATPLWPGENGGVRLYNKAGGMVSEYVIKSPFITSREYSIAISQSGDYFVAGSEDDSNLYFFSRSQGLVWSRNTGNIKGVFISSDGNYIAAATANNVYLLDRGNNILWSAAVSQIEDVAMSGDAGLLVVATASGKVYAFSRSGSIPLTFSLVNTWSRMPTLPVRVNAVCADGSNGTLIKVFVPASYNPRSFGFQVVSSGGSGEDGSVAIVSAIAGQIQLRYTAPNAFCRQGNSTDPSAVSRPTKLNVLYGSVICASIDFNLFRPPVIMLHGLWGKSAGWNNLVTYLKGNPTVYPDGLLYPYNYKQSHADSFSQNSWLCDHAIFLGIMRARELGYSANKVDLVCHSMGGVLARIYLQEAYGQKYKGDIHRLITIGTPYSGSQAADFLVSDLNLSTFLNRMGKRTDQGAVRDLSVDSQAIDTDINRVDVNGQATPDKNKVPSHVIVSTADVVDSKVEDLEWAPYVFVKAFYPSHPPLEEIKTKIFREENDLVVALSSQYGGLSKGTPFSHIAHVGAVKSSAVHERVRSLLNEPANSQQFSSAGFLPSNLRYNPLPFAPKPSQIAKQAGSISIVSPAPGSSVVSASSVRVVVSATAGVSPVMIASDSGYQTKSAPPFEFWVVIPSDALGNYVIVAVGFAGDTALFASVNLLVTTNASLQSLQTLPGMMVAVLVSQKTGFAVIGNFSDGTARDITSGACGTRYIVANRQIAVVESDGILRGISAGRTTLTISNGSIQSSLQVVVSAQNLTRARSDWTLYR